MSKSHPNQWHGVFATREKSRNAEFVTRMMPGQSFSLPFEVASSYRFACTAHASGQMTVTVLPNPAAGWERLAWRTRALMSSRG